MDSAQRGCLKVNSVFFTGRNGYFVILNELLVNVDNRVEVGQFRIAAISGQILEIAYANRSLPGVSQCIDHSRKDVNLMAPRKNH